MPLSPQKALSQSPAAVLTDDERETLKAFDAEVDAFLATEWNGGFVKRATPPLPPRVIFAIVRRWESAGWRVQLQPLDGAMATAADLLRTGADCPFMVTLAPIWPAREGC